MYEEELQNSREKRPRKGAGRNEEGCCAEKEGWRTEGDACNRGKVFDASNRIASPLKHGENGMKVYALCKWLISQIVF